MAHMIHRTGCCGVKEIRGIQTSGLDARHTMVVLAYDFFELEEDCAVLLFTENNEAKYKDGRGLRDYIHRNNLGTVVETSPKRNPNSGRMVVAYLWRIDIDAWQKWWNKISEKTKHRVLEDLDEYADDFWEDDDEDWD